MTLAARGDDPARVLKHVTIVMRPPERARPGPTPIIRIDGSVTTYILWIERPARTCEMLVIRCSDDGEMSARVCHELETV